MKDIASEETDQPVSFLKPALLCGFVSVALMMGGCASQPANEADPAATPEPVANVAPVAEQSSAPSVKQTEAKPSQGSAENTAKKAPPAPVVVTKAAAPVKAVTPAQPEPVVAAEPVADKQEQKADALMASLAKKDQYQVITETVKAPEPSAKANDAHAPVKKAEAKVAKKTPAKPKKLVQKALDVSKSDLPVTIDIWTLKHSTLPGDDSLVLTTPTWQMGGGDYLSQVWLTLRPGQLAVNSSSDIDASIAGSGVKFNGGELKTFTRIEDNNVAILEGDWIDELANGGSLEIMLGFFPDKKKTSPLFKSDASLDALSRLVPTLDALSQ